MYNSFLDVETKSLNELVDLKINIERHISHSVRHGQTKRIQELNTLLVEVTETLSLKLAQEKEREKERLRARDPARRKEVSKSDDLMYPINLGKINEQ